MPCGPSPLTGILPQKDLRAAGQGMAFLIFRGERRRVARSWGCLVPSISATGSASPQFSVRQQNMDWAAAQLKGRG